MQGSAILSRAHINAVVIPIAALITIQFRQFDAYADVHADDYVQSV